VKVNWEAGSPDEYYCIQTVPYLSFGVKELKGIGQLDTSDTGGIGL